MNYLDLITAVSDAKADQKFKCQINADDQTLTIFNKQTGEEVVVTTDDIQADRENTEIFEQEIEAFQDQNGYEPSNFELMQGIWADAETFGIYELVELYFDQLINETAE